MADTYTDILRLVQPAAGDTSWSDNYYAMQATLETVVAPTNCYFVSPAFTAAALGNGSATDRRHFDTIQAAVTAAENGDSTWGNNQDVNVVMVYPGVYEENIEITGNVAIVGVVPNRYRAESRFCAKLRGTADTQSPIITITPRDGVVCRVYLSNLNFDQQYAAATTEGVEIDNAMLIDIVAPSSYDSIPSTLVLDRCDFYAEPRGTNNLWAAGVRARGWAKVGVYDSQFRVGDYGGQATRGITNAISVIGVDNTSRSILQVSRSDFQHNYRGGAFPGVSSLFHGDYIYSVYDRSSFYRSTGNLYTDVGSGTNYWYGIVSETLALRGNLDWHDAVYF